MARIEEYKIPCTLTDEYDFSTMLVFPEDNIDEDEICIKITGKHFVPNTYGPLMISAGHFGREYTHVGSTGKFIDWSDLKNMITDLVDDSKIMDYLYDVCEEGAEVNMLIIDGWCEDWMEENDAESGKPIPKELQLDMIRKILEAEKNGTIDDLTE